ncbi:hypothetical protein NRK67_03260 [Fusobacteria bacterium ZRK30]|nr:hypothetical protein NRK67_03260 [Fusobacteria bacterium ZRK30]
MVAKKEPKKKKITKIEEKKIKESIEVKKKKSTFYIGPGVQRGILDKGTVFIGDLPEEVEKLKVKYPSIVPMFVTENEYVTAFNEINQPGTVINILFNKAVEEVMN